MKLQSLAVHSNEHAAPTPWHSIVHREAHVLLHTAAARQFMLQLVPSHELVQVALSSQSTVQLPPEQEVAQEAEPPHVTVHPPPLHRGSHTDEPSQSNWQFPSAQSQVASSQTSTPEQLNMRPGFIVGAGPS